MTFARLISLAAAAALGASAGPAWAQGPTAILEADVSAREIAIESTFTGVRIVVFGTVLPSGALARQDYPFDVAVVIRGPDEPVVVRRKSRIAGIWINTEAQSFGATPGYYAMLSTRALEDMARPEVLRDNAIGFDNLALERAGDGSPVEAGRPAFRAAAIRLKERQGLYLADEAGVEFIGSQLFRATVDLPANVPVGEFTIDIYLFHEALLLNRHTSRLVIRKQGFEEIVHTMAFDRPLLYGLLAVLMAVGAGLTASAMFRRD